MATYQRNTEVVFRGEILTISDLAKKVGKHPNLVLDRIQRGWSVEDAAALPMQRRNERHGMSATPEYAIWSGMIGRCHNINDSAYHKYGAKGIVVCGRWRTSFVAFYEDMGNRPSKIHSLDRFPNRNGNYEPGNVRWATPSQQAFNRDVVLYARGRRMFTVAGERKCLSEWADRLGIAVASLLERLEHMPVEQALTMPKVEGAVNFRDLTGQRFGTLTVLRHDGTGWGKAMWLCRCDCGKETRVIGTNLTRPAHLRPTRGCGPGCPLKAAAVQARKELLVGTRIGSFTVLSMKQGKHFVRYECRCDCGAIRRFTKYSLRDMGPNPSCGRCDDQNKDNRPARL